MKISAAVLFASICVSIFLVTTWVEDVRAWVIAALLPKDLEQVTPAAELVILPFQLIAAALEAGQLFLISTWACVIGLIKAIFGDGQWTVPLQGFYLAVIGAAAFLTNLVLGVCATPGAVLAFVVGWLLTLSLMAPGWTSIGVAVTTIAVVLRLRKRSPA